MRLLPLLFVAAMVGFGAASPIAEEASPGRYAIEPSEDGGFIRLDTETGAVSHCGKRDGIWYCEGLAEDRSAIDALAAEGRALRAKVEALSARLDAVVTDAPGVVALPPGGDNDIAEAEGFAEILMRRFFEMVREMKRGTQEAYRQ
jgi:hypothetical protein